MSTEGPEELDTTTSLCPTCLERVPGRYEARDGSVYLTRECPDHGVASRKVWGSVDHWAWAGELGPEFASEVGVDEGELTVDADHACLAVVEVTTDCNLSCSFCFAGSGPGGDHLPESEVVDLLETVKAAGGPRPIQFSGGEPTVRDDLPELVGAARGMGFEHVQVNTNGLRLANEAGYAERLADAGVTAIYLQFDDVDSHGDGDAHESIRGADLAAAKREAVEACREADLSVVLVPTVVPGVNADRMGDIVEFGLDNVDVVESINFQPVAHFGRYGEHDGRFALDDAARALAEQVDAVDTRDMLPIPCCSSYCQMATVLKPSEGDGDPLALTGLLDDDTFGALSGLVDEADWMELLANTKTAGERACSTAGCCGLDLPAGADEILDRVLPVSFTGFMDADAADVERLDNCCVSVPTPDGDLVPFCGYNMTTEDGEYALRTRNGWGGETARTGVDADLPAAPDAGDDGDGAMTGDPASGVADDDDAGGEGTAADGAVTDGGCGCDSCGAE
ncbi:radical SAM protein [Halobaculum sp. EA56]|uniref:radical SAM protein n=1 Tax=Halobaculum sp. EA56 TaxID=3421648 RepID=UPI003EC02DC4